MIYIGIDYKMLFVTLILLLTMSTITPKKVQRRSLGIVYGVHQHFICINFCFLSRWDTSFICIFSKHGFQLQNSWPFSHMNIELQTMICKWSCLICWQMYFVVIHKLCHGKKNSIDKCLCVTNIVPRFDWPILFVHLFGDGMLNIILFSHIITKITFYHICSNLCSHLKIIFLDLVHWLAQPSCKACVFFCP